MSTQVTQAPTPPRSVFSTVGKVFRVAGRVLLAPFRVVHWCAYRAAPFFGILWVFFLVRNPQTRFSLGYLHVWFIVLVLASGVVWAVWMMATGQAIPPAK